MKTSLVLSGVRFWRGSFCLRVDKLEITDGGLVCVTGPNGSGKSTLLQGLTGLLQPAEGSIQINGQNIGSHLQHVKSQIGYIPDDEDWFIKELTATEYFELLIGVYTQAGHAEGLMRTRAASLANELRFTSHSQQLASLSHGNKKKVQIIAGLMHAPKLLVVDELRNGLDPLAIIAAEKVISAQVNQGTCVVAATHDLWWAERMADTILLLLDGKIIVHDTKKHLVDTHHSLEELFISTTSKRLPA